MKKSLSALKEKFGKFEVSKEQVKKIKGGEEPLCQTSVEVPSPGEDPCGGDTGSGIGGVHCPSGISESWCYNRSQYSCGNFQICFDQAAYAACIRTCKACKKC